MKIVILKGSPHINGSSNALANSFIKGAKEKGHQVIEFDIAHMNIHPCIGCEHCGMNGECIFKDDNQKVRNELLNTDMVVFVTPVYYFGLTAQLKAVIDRFYSYTIKLSNKGLKAVLISAAWNTDNDTLIYLEEHYKKLCRYMNFDNIGVISGKGCGTKDMTLSTKYVKDAYELGKAI